MIGAALDTEPFRVERPTRPYPGLRPFEKHEWPIFFGREIVAEEMIERLIDSQLVVIHGDSGCGKSSLVRAAVLPRLEQESARGGIRWRTCTARPGDSPLWNLAYSLASLGDEGSPDDRALAVRRVFNLRRDAPAALAAELQVGRNEHVCLLIDQFEELFDHARKHGPVEATLLAEFLSGMSAAPPPGLYVALTMRSEYLGSCARFAGLSDAVNATQYLLPGMTYDDLRCAIREPARLYGGEVDQALADRLIADAADTTDKLPLLQHALMLLHRRELEQGQVEGWRLELSDYPSDTGLAGLLSGHADEVMQEAHARAGLPEDSRVVEDLFRAIMDTNADRHPIRRPQLFHDLVEIVGTDESTLRIVVDTFSADGVSFIVAQRDVLDPRRERIDVAHEALLRCWNKIAAEQDGWLAREFRNGLVWKSLLVQVDSFERNRKNVLAPATTQERRRWMLRRNRSWAERYGGGWDRVQRMLEASTAAHVATTRKTRLLQGLIGLVVLVAVVESWILMAQARSSEAEAVQFDQENRALVEQLLESQAAEAELRTQLEAQLKASVASLEETVRQLELTTDAEQVVSSARLEVNAISQAVTQLSATTAAPSASGDLAPRVYIQIAESAQRSVVEEFRRRLSARDLRGAAILAPGIELVKASPPQTVLRCFRANECRDDGPALIAVVNSLLEAPQARLEDLSARYGESTSIRDRHFELWFAAGEVDVKE